MNTLQKFSHMLLLTLAVVMCSTQVIADPARDYQAALQDWATVLEQYVDEQGRIDFYAIAEDDAGLNRFVAAVGAYGPTSHPQDFTSSDAVMAYHLNSYNALAMHGVIERGIPKGFTSVFSRLSFFKLRSVTIAGEKTNLHAYENKVIRPLDEPRSHFALNCMVKDCPRLPRTPFSADKLDAQLEAASREFFNKDLHLRLDHAKKRIMVSAILDFYTEDFVASGKAADLPAYINKYRQEPLPADYKVKFIKYDWRINQQPEL